LAIHKILDSFLQIRLISHNFHILISLRTNIGNDRHQTIDWMIQLNQNVLPFSHMVIFNTHYLYYICFFAYSFIVLLKGDSWFTVKYSDWIIILWIKDEILELNARYIRLLYLSAKRIRNLFIMTTIQMSQYLLS
jgi:hypothetical protein